MQSDTPPLIRICELIAVQNVAHSFIVSLCLAPCRMHCAPLHCDNLWICCYFPLAFSIYRPLGSVRITFSTYHPVAKSPFVESTTFCSISSGVFCLNGTTEWKKEIRCRWRKKKIRPVPELNSIADTIVQISSSASPAANWPFRICIAYKRNSIHLLCKLWKKDFSPVITGVLCVVASYAGATRLPSWGCYLYANCKCTMISTARKMHCFIFSCVRKKK